MKFCLLCSRMFAVFVLLSFTGLCVVAPALSEENPRVRLETSKGNILLELDAVKAPVTVANFLAYVDDGFYSGTIFHRVIKGFMIQGGGVDSTLAGKATRAPIVNEAGNGLQNKAYTIAMARTAEADSATSQFFINHVDNPLLDKTETSAGYAVFGTVVEGKEVVEAIAAVETVVYGNFKNLPKESVVIDKAVRVASETPVDPPAPGGGGGGGGCFLGSLL